MRTGKKHRKELMAGKTPGSPMWKLADKLVYSKLKEAFGGKANIYVSGGAPLGMDSAEWFLDMGIRIFEGYGLTETSPVISRNTFDGYRIGTVGTVIPNLELRMAEDGEIEVRGTTVFSGYWQSEEASKREFTADGWFKTGDIGKYEDGFLSITDRKKELIKTSSGKYIAPQPIEGKLKADELVGNAAVIGDSRKFAAVLISPDFQALGRWAGGAWRDDEGPCGAGEGPEGEGAVRGHCEAGECGAAGPRAAEEGGRDAGGVEHRGRGADAEHEAEAAGDLRAVQGPD